MWLPEIYNRMEGTQLAICQSTSSHNHTILYENKTFNFSTTDIAGGEVCRRDLYTNRVVYLKTFLIAASNIPGAITSIVCIDKIGRRNLLGKNFFTRIIESQILIVR